MQRLGLPHFEKKNDPTWQNITPEFRLYCYNNKNASTKKVQDYIK
jgi:hypothetical protein